MSGLNFSDSLKSEESESYSSKHQPATCYEPNFKGEFFQAFVGKSTGVGDGVPQICIDDFMEEQKIQRLNILHSDIQGFDLEMLQGAVNSIREQKIDYCFVSTHSNALHSQCTEFLRSNGCVIIASCDLDNSYSPDGVLVARRGSLNGLAPIEIAQRQRVEAAKIEAQRSESAVLGGRHPKGSS